MDVEWNMFWSSFDDISKFVEATISFTGKLAEEVKPTITIKNFSNRNPWVDNRIITSEQR